MEISNTTGMVVTNLRHEGRWRKPWLHIGQYRSDYKKTLLGDWEANCELFWKVAWQHSRLWMCPEGFYVEKHDRNKMNSWFWEQKGICQYQPRCCLGNCSRWKSRIQNEGWAKWRFSGTQVLQLFRESSASFHSPLRVTLFQNERFGWFGYVSVPWQVFRGSFTTLLPKRRSSCECVQWTFKSKTLWRRNGHLSQQL